MTLHESLKAAKELESGENKLNVRVLDLISLKPLDRDGLRKNIEECGGRLLVVEEHYPEGGAGEAICGAASGSIKKFEHLCVKRVPGSAKPTEQMELYEVDCKAIVERARKMME